jgi:hypothetical protein
MRAYEQGISMRTILRVLCVIACLCPLVAMCGCGAEETVVPGTEEQVSEKFPAPPGKSGGGPAAPGK